MPATVMPEAAMDALRAATLLDVWERGHARPPAERALLLLAAARPHTPPDALAALPLGRRDADLFALRAQLFGETMESVVPCPACGETLELALPVGALLDAHAPPESPPLHLEAEGYAVAFRLPTTADLLAVAAAEHSALPARRLLRRCLIAVEPTPPDEALPDAVADAVATAMAAADPAARVTLDLRCPACDYGWASLLDVVGYLWTELDAWARRTLREVHDLACAYGWREADVLALSAWRRRQYLSLIRA